MGSFTKEAAEAGTAALLRKFKTPEEKSAHFRGVRAASDAKRRLEREALAAVAAALADESRAAQGLPPRVTDADALRRVAVLLADREKAASDE